MDGALTVEAVFPAEERGGMADGRLAQLFDDHRARLYRLALRMTADAEDARDLVQEAFVRAARALDSIPAEAGAAEAWLVRVVVNLCRDRYRRRRVSERALREVAVEARADAAPAPAAPLSRAVAAALAGLPARQRAIVALHDLEEHDTAAIARLLGVAQVTVRWHLAAGRRALRRRLAPLLENER